MIIGDGVFSGVLLRWWMGPGMWAGFGRVWVVIGVGMFGLLFSLSACYR